MSAPQIPQSTTLKNQQTYSKQLVGFKNWRGNGPELLMLMSEEVGEAAKEIRRLHFNQGDQNQHQKNLGHELVDILAYVCRIANHYNIDLEHAYQEKNTEILVRKTN